MEGLGIVNTGALGVNGDPYLINGFLTRSWENQYHPYKNRLKSPDKSVELQPQVSKYGTSGKLWPDRLDPLYGLDELRPKRLKTLHNCTIWSNTGACSVMSFCSRLLTLKIKHAFSWFLSWNTPRSKSVVFFGGMRKSKKVEQTGRSTETGGATCRGRKACRYARKAATTRAATPRKTAYQIEVEFISAQGLVVKGFSNDNGSLCGLITAAWSAWNNRTTLCTQHEVP